MIAYIVQADTVWEDRAANHQRIESLLESAKPAPGSLVVLPELFDTGFSFRLEITADRDGKTLAFLQRAAAKFNVTLHGSRSVIGPDSRGRNRATICGPTGAVLCEYDKIHPFSFGRESEFFSGGTEVMTYEWNDGQDKTVVCPAICYDLRFPELFREGLAMGAEVMVVGANWPSPRAMHRSALLVARAIENQAFVIGVNRAGKDPHLTYAGASMALNAKGDVVVQCGEGELVAQVDVDIAAVRAWRETFPAWRDRRLE